MGIFWSTTRLDSLEKRVKALERKVGPTMLPDDLKREIHLYTKDVRYPDVAQDYGWQPDFGW